MKKEVCEELSRKGYGEYKEMLYILGVEGSIEKEVSSVIVESKEGSIEKEVSSVIVESKERSIEKEVSSVIVENSIVSVKLPWCGKVLMDRCKALVYNGGLYSQCMKVNDLYCKGCMNKKEKNGDVFVYGTVEERLRCDLLEYKDSKGKCEVIYSSVMRKEGISREEAESAAKELGWEIPECYFELKGSKRGRPKKNVEKENKVEKKTRGRPKKEKETVVGNVGEDLIASLIEDSVECEEECEEECEVTKQEYNGRMYLKTESNVLYDIESHDYVGVWNGESIDEIEEEE